jgi:hypothetical protein
MMMAFSFVWIEAFVSMPGGFKLSDVSMSMKNDPLSVINAEELIKGSGRRTEAINVLLSEAVGLFVPRFEYRLIF